MGGPYHPWPMVPDPFRSSLVLPLLIMLGGLLGAIGLYGWAILLRIADRQVPHWLGRATAFLLGVGLSAGVFTLTPGNTPTAAGLSLAGILVAPALSAGARRFDLAGWTLLGTGLPPLLWWGWFAAGDVISGAVTYEEPLWLWTAGAAAVTAAGLIGIRVGNRRTTAPLPPADQPDPNRAVSIAYAMQRELQLGPVDVPNAASLAAGGIAGLVAWMGAYALGAGDLPSAAIGVLVIALVSNEVFYRAWPRRLARAMAAHAFLGSWEMRRFRQDTGTRPPTSVAAARRWLEQNPESDANRWARIELLAWTGRLAEAEATANRLEVTTEAERFERDAIRVLLDIVAGRDADVAGLSRAAEMVGEPGSDERLRALTAAALAESRRRLAHGGTGWMEPLLDVQKRIGDRSLGITRADTWLPRFGAVATATASIVALGWLLSLLTA
jgi:hypothetical protein